MEITVCLLEAADPVDTGGIVARREFAVPDHALHDEINALLFAAELELMDYAVQKFPDLETTPQATDREPTYYPRRTAADSEIDPGMSIEEQFDLIRVCDPERYPAFFHMRGWKYKLTIEKFHDDK
jgi:methionyl-tRNA formyltransferase